MRNSNFGLRLCACIGAFFLSVGGNASSSEVSQQMWGKNTAPIAFKYDGRKFIGTLPAWGKVERSNSMDRSQKISTRDPRTGLCLQAEVRSLKGFDAVEWVLHFENRGANDTPILEDVEAAAFTLPAPKRGNFTLRHADGSTEKITDFQPHSSLLPVGQVLKFAPFGGRSSDGVLPFFNIVSPDGGGWIVAIGWTGQWAASFERLKDGQLSIHAGMERTHLILHPSEKIRTPAILLMRYKGDWMEGQNEFRRLMLAYYTPRPNGQLPVMPVAASGALIGFNNVSETNQISAIENVAAKKTPVDYWWIDAGWSLGGFPLGMGNWNPDPTRFPLGLRPVADAVHKAGLKFLVWFEPERVMSNTWLFVNHPEWLLKPSDMPKPVKYQQNDNWRLLNLGNPEALAWAKETFYGYIRDLKLSVYRNDFNMHPLWYWRTDEPADRQGINEIRYVMGLYDFFDSMQQEFPGLLIDNCASGGRRLDFEMARRSVPLLRSDYLWDPVGAQSLTYALSFWLPLHGQGGVSVNDYDFYSGLGSCVVYAFDFYEITNGFWPVFNKKLAGFLPIQPTFSGDFHPLTDYSTNQNAWVAWQFDRPDLGLGIVQAFRRTNAIPEVLHVNLKSLKPRARYEIKNLDGGVQIRRGRELINDGLDIRLKNKPDTSLLIYRKLPN